MGYFDNNVHMNGAGTTYQAFLDLADAAEAKGGQIGNRTVRLVKAGDGLATTTSRGLKGARATQIADARNAFLLAIAREFGYAARNIAEKTLGAGENAVPLTARSIRAVNQALGDKNALAADSALIREFKMDFDLEVAAARQYLSLRLGVAVPELDRGKIQAVALKLIEDGTFPNTKDGMRKAVREVAAPRVAAAARLEPMLRAKGVPAHLAPVFADKLAGKGVEVLDNLSLHHGDAVTAALDALAAKYVEEDPDAIAALAVDNAETLLATLFGREGLEDEDAQKELNALKAKLAALKRDNLSPAAFKAGCETALKVTVRTYCVRQIAMNMAMVDSDNPAYGRIGSRFYDALGFGKGENDRAVTDYALWKLPSEDITKRLASDAKTPAELRRQAAKLVFVSIAEDYLKQVPPLADEHRDMDSAKLPVVRKIALALVDRFETAATDGDFASLADNFKTQVARQLDRTNATLKNLDLALDQAKGELEGRLEQLAGQYGVPLTQGIRDMFSKTLAEAVTKMKANANSVEKALSADECKAALLDRVEQKWLAPCRQAAAELDASALEPAQKKAFLATVMANKVDVPFVKMALRVVPSFDAKELVAAAKAGDGRKLVEQFSRFIATTNAMLTDKAELKSIEGSDDYSAFMGTAADLLFAVNPDLVETVRGLDADTRGKLFEDAERASSDKSSAIQAKAQSEADKQQARIVAHEARYWSAANACVMQLQEATA
jgi:hypothetical protein